MSAPDKCPKCGAGNGVVGWEFIYDCGSYFSAEEAFNENKGDCVRRQRDQLATKLSDLESAYAECAEKLYCAEQREHVLKRRLEYYTGQRDKLLERVKRLEEAGDIMATWAPLDRVITWTKAKGQP